MWIFPKKVSFYFISSYLKVIELYNTRKKSSRKETSTSKKASNMYNLPPTSNEINNYLNQQQQIEELEEIEKAHTQQFQLQAQEEDDLVVNPKTQENNQEKKDIIVDNIIISQFNDDVLFDNYSEQFNPDEISLNSKDEEDQEGKEKEEDEFDLFDPNNILFYSFNHSVEEAEKKENVDYRGEKLLRALVLNLNKEKQELLNENTALWIKRNTLLKAGSLSHSNNTNQTGNTGGTGNTGSNTMNNFYVNSNVVFNPQNTNPFQKVASYDEHEQQFNLSNTNFHNQQTVHRLSNKSNLQAGNKEKEKEGKESKESNKLGELINEFNGLLEIFEKTATTKNKFSQNSNNNLSKFK